MSAARRFWGAGLRQIDQRLTPLTRPDAGDDRIALKIAESSRVFGLVARAAAMVGAAARSSACLRIARTMDQQWQASAWNARVRASGVLLFVAGLTHIVLNAAAAAPVGWLWLVVPGAAIVSGAWLVVAARLGPSGTNLS